MRAVSPSFIGCNLAFADARIVVYGIPFEGRVNLRKGADAGPLDVRLGSESIETYSPALTRDLEDLAPAFPDLRILHLDAHPDLREEFLGERYNYASAMARVMDVVPPERVYQVGMRTGAREEYHRRRPHFFPMYPMLTGHPVDVVRRLLPELQRHPLYVTIDVDVLDPAEAPGTGSPEPGGLRVPELVEIVRMLEGCQVIGGDLVEVAHAWDPSGRTGIAASWVIREALLAWWGELR